MPRQSLRNRPTAADTTPAAKPEAKTTRATKRKATKQAVKDEEDVKGEEDEKAEEDEKDKQDVKGEEDEAGEPVEAPNPKKRKTSSKKTKPEDTMPLAERTAVASLKKAMYIGAHVSAAGGVQNSMRNAVEIGANAFALFLKSQRKWANPPLAPDALDTFRDLGQHYGFEPHKHCLPHGSYLVNLAQNEAAKAAQAYDSFLDDLRRCEALGIALYNFHPGNTQRDTKAAAIGRIAAQLNKAHAATSTVVTVLENMAGQGNVVGSTFEDLRDIIALVDDKTRVGVCLDTCHTFAAGYDLRSPAAFAATMAAFDATVGPQYLRALHLNDSKAPLGSNRDLHANIGTGFLGLRAFHCVMNHAAFQNMPLVLETPIERKGPEGKTVEDKQVWAYEIKLLESLIGMDPESAQFGILEAELQARGAAERNKLQDQVDRKAAKDAKKGTKGKKGAKKKDSDDESASE